MVAVPSSHRYSFLRLVTSHLCRLQTRLSVLVLWWPTNPMRIKSILSYREAIEQSTSHPSAAGDISALLLVLAFSTADSSTRETGYDIWSLIPICKHDGMRFSASECVWLLSSLWLWHSLGPRELQLSQFPLSTLFLVNCSRLALALYSWMFTSLRPNEGFVMIH